MAFKIAPITINKDLVVKTTAYTIPNIIGGV